jgi:wobble nucleotide-excising tRNase
LKLKIQEIHNSIRADVEKFYSTLHPGEEHSEIKILIDFTKKRSTNLQVNSYDVMVDPRAFQSEGHLDSLGLCIFLAFIKRSNVECDLVILDDVVTTVDAKHRARICRLLYEDFRDKQMIITTCDNVWYQQLVAHQPRLGVQGKFKNIIIADWDVDTGPP